MSRISDILDAIDGRLRAAQTADGVPVFADVRIHLDPYTLDDLLRESVRVPAARILLVDAKPERNAGGSLNLACRLAIVIVAGREGRHDERVASADLAALELALVAAGIVHDDPYFGIGRLRAAQVGELGITMSERAKGNTRGAAISAVNVSTVLLDVIPEPAVIARAAATGRNSWAPAGLEINGVAVPLEEICIEPEGGTS